MIGGVYFSVEKINYLSEDKINLSLNQKWKSEHKCFGKIFSIKLGYE